MYYASFTELKSLAPIGKKLSSCIKELVEKMGQRIKQSEKELADKEAENQELLEKTNRTSKNSSSPPSCDPLNAEKQKLKKKGDKKRGGQAGHKGHSRFLYDTSECSKVLEHHPETCKCCKQSLVASVHGRETYRSLGRLSPQLHGQKINPTTYYGKFYLHRGCSGERQGSRYHQNRFRWHPQYLQYLWCALDQRERRGHPTPFYTTSCGWHSDRQGEEWPHG